MYGRDGLDSQPIHLRKPAMGAQVHLWSFILKVSQNTGVGKLITWTLGVFSPLPLPLVRVAAPVAQPRGRRGQGSGVVVPGGGRVAVLRGLTCGACLHGLTPAGLRHVLEQGFLSTTEGVSRRS